MRFKITLNMPSRAGNPVHQVVGDHSAQSLEEFAEKLTRHDFVIVDEIHIDSNTQKRYSVGLTLIRSSLIGKVKEDAPQE